MNPSTTNRRCFLTRAGALAAAVAYPTLAPIAKAARSNRHTRVARYWEPIPGTDKVRCKLCPHQEVLEPGQLGFCWSRRNQAGRLVTDAWNRPAALSIEPVEANPLAHFAPGTKSLAVGHAGCNLRCAYCQNHEQVFTSPEYGPVVSGFEPDAAIRAAQDRGVGALSFTFSEPTVSLEWILEMAKKARWAGLKITLCTAGFASPEPLAELLRVVDAVTVTYKGPDQTFYKKMIGGKLAAVQATLVQIRKSGVWLEVASLVVPGYNDDPGSLESMAAWISKNLGRQTPWHLERFEPAWRLEHLAPTSQASLERAREIGLATGLRYVYLTNLAPHPGNHTRCPKCERVVVRRLGFKVLENDLPRGVCSGCKSTIPGRWA